MNIRSCVVVCYIPMIDEGKRAPDPRGTADLCNTYILK